MKGFFRQVPVEDAAQDLVQGPVLEAAGGTPRARFRPWMRLSRRRDYSRVYRDGARARGGSLLVVAAPNDTPVTRLGLSVGRSIWKRAVHRNREKRILREAFRLEYPLLPKGFDLIVIPTRPGEHLGLSSSREELASLARRACRPARREKRPAQDADRRP